MPNRTRPCVWMHGTAANGANLERAKNMFAEVNRLERDDMASLSVALRLLRSIVRR